MKALLALLLLTGQAATAAECRDAQVDLRGPKGQARFSVEIADTGPERAEGLMFREKMAATHGMLFVYDKAGPVAFWMENTLIPLDMIFVGADGTVVSVHENARPLDRTGIPSGAPAQFVLEINGGMAARLGIAAGSQMRHPRIAQATAVWPCE
jgi:uncharacterized membrane protein (UPF0127 family)